MYRVFNKYLYSIHLHVHRRCRRQTWIKIWQFLAGKKITSLPDIWVLSGYAIGAKPAHLLLFSINIYFCP